MVRKIALLAAGIGFLALAPVAEAHHTGNERRTADECKITPGMEKGERAACIRCVADGKHHYHPHDRAGDRCHRDNGRPQ